MKNKQARYSSFSILNSYDIDSIHTKPTKEQADYDF
jgi:hypothetical protein